MNNPLLTEVIEARNGHYCHALEVNDVYELEGVVEGVIESSPDHTEATYIEFFNSIELYCLNDENEEEVLCFDFADFIDCTIND